MTSGSFAFTGSCAEARTHQLHRRAHLSHRSNRWPRDFLRPPPRARAAQAAPQSEPALVQHRGQQLVDEQRLERELEHCAHDAHQRRSFRDLHVLVVGSLVHFSAETVAHVAE